jgi:hypothetical protein
MDLDFINWLLMLMKITAFKKIVLIFFVIEQNYSKTINELYSTGLRTYP